MELTEEQRSLRRTGISASDAGAVLGLSPFTTQADVWAIKVGIKDEDPENNYMEWGKRLEAVVLDKYSDVMGVEAEQWTQGTLVHPEHATILATPDAMATETKGDEDFAWLVEVKTCGSWDDWGEPGTDEVPKSYLVQVMQQMEVCDIDRCDIAVLNVRAREFRVYHVMRDKKAGARLMDKLVAWWMAYVVGGKAPPDEEGMNSVRAGQEQEGEPQEATEADAASMRMLAAMRQAKKGFEENEKSYIEALKTSLDLSPGIVDKATGNKIVYKLPKQKSKVNWEDLARDLGCTPEQIAKHTRTFRTKRSFRFYPGESK